MTDVTADFERRLTASVRAYADRSELAVSADRVVADVLAARPRRSRWLIPGAVAAAVLLVAGGLAGVQFLNQAASTGATAQVNGRTYQLWVTRNMEIDAANLQLYGEVASTDASMFAETAAFELDGVDPLVALVVRLKPGVGDDSGPYGDWILLIRGAVPPELCTYLATSDNPPDDCLLFSS